MRLTQTSDLWWKNAVVYCLDVETFLDCDGDGCGDFRGLTEQIDYLAGSGVTCLWLMPFYPSPDRDDGYDITDFYGVDPRLGTLGDFVELVRTARDRGIRVIADLVVNHTSDQHPWFQEARSSPRLAVPRLVRLARRAAAGRPAGRRLPGPGDQHLGVRRGGRGSTTCTGSTSSSPTSTSPTPRCATRSRGSWGSGCERGCPASGWTPCRSCSRRRRSSTRRPARPARVPRDLRAFLDRRNGEAILLGEVNLPHADTMRSSSATSDGDELHHVLRLHRHAGDVPVAGARRRRAAGRGAARAARSRPTDAHWATFVRNHDELTLDKLTEAERQEVFDALRPRQGHAALRPRPAPAAAADARRRPAPDPDGLQPAVLAARHAGAVLRRGDRHGREPRDRGPARRPRADAVDRRAGRRLLDGRPVDVPGADGRGRVRARARQRPRPARATPTRC